MTLRRLLVPLAIMSLLFLGGVILRYSGKVAVDPRWKPVVFGAEVRADGSVWSFQDFTAHLNSARGAWNQTASRPYTDEAHLPVFRAWLGTTPSAVLPFSYSPVALLVALPFLPLPAAWAYGLFVGLGLALFFWFVARILSPRIQTAPQRWMAAASLCSAAYFTNLGAGQTALITTALTGWCWHRLHEPGGNAWRPAGMRLQILLGMILFLYAGKPNLAFTLGAILLAAGAWGSVAGATVVFFLTFVALAPWLGGFPQDLVDYRNFLAKYDQESIGPLFQAALDPKIYTNFQSFLMQGEWIRPALAAKINHGLWLGGTLGAIFLARTRRVDPVTFLELHLAIFLLFCPSVNSTEDLILCLLVGVSPFFQEARGWPFKLALVFLAVNGGQNVGLLPGTPLASWPMAFWAKSALAVWGFCWHWRKAAMDEKTARCDQKKASDCGGL
jgi:hypothetical protein